MDSRKVDQVQDFSRIDFAGWDQIPSNSIALSAAPLGLQPNGFIHAAVEVGSYGLLQKIVVKTVHDDGRIAFRLSWTDDTRDTGEGEGFPDGAVVAFPVRGDPAIHTMGQETAPIHAIQWSALNNQVRCVLATGIGTSRDGPDLQPQASSEWLDGQWVIVMTHALRAADSDSVRLSTDNKTGVGFVVWNGSRLERAGIKSYSPVWTALTLAQ